MHSFLPSDDYIYDVESGHITLIERQTDSAKVTHALADMANQINKNKLDAQDY